MDIIHTYFNALDVKKQYIGIEITILKMNTFNKLFKDNNRYIAFY